MQIELDKNALPGRKIHRPEEFLIRSFCFIGTPGTEKTRTLRTFMPPDWKEGDHPWAYIFACDRKKDGGMAVLRGVPGVEYDVFINPEIHSIPAMGAKYTFPEPKALERLIGKFNDILDLARDPDTFPYYLVAIDTASGLKDIIFDEIFYKSRNKKMNPKVSPELQSRIRPSMDDIGNCQWYMMQYIKSLNQLPCVTVTVCHQYFVQEDLEGKMKIFPELPGKKINDQFLSLFDEVFYFSSKTGGGVQVQTERTLTMPARTSQPALSKVEVPDFQVWAAKMSKYYAGLTQM